MAALLCDVGPGDEVICPSYTFVSSINPFVMRGATIVFADSSSSCPNIDIKDVERLITKRTKVIIVVNYAGVGVDVKAIRDVAPGCFIVEDAAQSLMAFTGCAPQGTLGDVGCVSFHATKNISCGEGGALILNNKTLVDRAEIIREKGTNRSSFYRGQVDKYSWVDIGSSFLPSDITAAFLYGNLLEAELITKRRKEVWNLYDQSISTAARIKGIATSRAVLGHNAHIYSLVFKNGDTADNFSFAMRNAGIEVASHYVPLHTSYYGKKIHDGRLLPNAEKYGRCLVRLPNYFSISNEDAFRVIERTLQFIDEKI